MAKQNDYNPDYSDVKVLTPQERLSQLVKQIQSDLDKREAKQGK